MQEIAGPAAPATLVIPCFNEAARLDGSALLELVDRRAELSLLCVNDGSTDTTGEVIEALVAARPGRVAVLSNPRNVGKAESVRRGLAHSLAGAADVVGYFDADLSTPPAEIGRLLDEAEARATSASVVLGSRIMLLGTDIRRSAARHYLGRVFASAASLLLDLPVYDTQCGAKLFRRSDALVAALEQPFISRWAFDVELIGRLLIGTPQQPGLSPQAFVEVPLQIWHDVPGSKLRPLAMARVLPDLARIAVDFRARRRALPGARP